MTDTLETQITRRWLSTILIVSIALRVAAALYLGDTVGPMPGTYDQVSYDKLAQRLLDGHGFTFDKLWWPYTQPGEPTAHWSFLYTLYLTGLYALVGYHPLVARLVQAVLVGALMPWLVYRIGSRHFGRQVGLVSSGVMACYAYFIYYAGTLMTENFYITGILWVLDIAGQLGQEAENPSAVKYPGLVLGLALGVTVLLRQLFLLLIPFLFLWLLWRSYRYQARPSEPGVPANNNEVVGAASSGVRGLLTRLQNTPVARMLGVLLTVTLIVLIAIAPWTIRNYLAFDRFVLLNTNAGFAFYWANHPIHGQHFPADLPDWESYVELIPRELLPLNEAALDQALLSRAVDLIRDDPRRYVMLSLSRFDDYFMFWPSATSSLISNVSRVLSFGLLWPLMLYGLIAHVRRSFSSTSFILYLFIILYTSIHLLSWTLIRYRLPVDAILIIFAGRTLVEIQAKLAQRQLKGRIPAAEIQT